MTNGIYFSITTPIQESVRGIEEILKLSNVSDAPLKRLGEMYSAIAREYGARTIADAREVIRKGQIPEYQVKKWISEYCFTEGGQYSALVAGYPQLKQDADAAKRRRLEEKLST